MAQDTPTTGIDNKRKDKTITLGPHVFRMSSYEKQEDILKMWLIHFERLGVPAAIVKSKVITKERYSVWKYGLEYVSPKSPSRLERATGKIMEEVNNFGNYWRLDIINQPNQLGFFRRRRKREV